METCEECATALRRGADGFLARILRATASQSSPKMLGLRLQQNRITRTLTAFPNEIEVFKRGLRVNALIITDITVIFYPFMLLARFFIFF